MKNSFEKIYYRFNLVSLLLNFSVFILCLMIEGEYATYANILYPYIALQCFLIIFSMFHYAQTYILRQLNKSNLNIFKQFFDFVPLFELLIVINFEFRYFYFRKIISWSIHLKLIYFMLKSILNSIKNDESMKYAYLTNSAYIGILISNIWVIYGFENMQMTILLVNQIVIALFSLMVLLFFLRKKHSQARIFATFINEMSHPLYIIEEVKKQKSYKMSYITKQAFHLLENPKKKKKINYNILNNFCQGFKLKKNAKEKSLPKDKTNNKKIENEFNNLTELIQYYNRKFTKEKGKNTYMKKKFMRIQNKETDLFLTIMKTKIQNKTYFFLKMKEKQIKSRKNFEFENRLLTSISHELKTPLNGSLPLLEILRTEFDEDSNAFFLIKNSIASLNLLENSLNNIIDNSLFLTNEFILCLSYVNIKESMVQIYEITKSQIELKSLKFSIEIEGFLSVQSIYTDNTRLKQVILNIILNSIQFTNNGFIKVIVRVISKSPLELEFMIEDSGTGMTNEFSKELLKKINDENTDFQANSTGSCMGLTITNKLVFLLGNKNIEINSDYGKGTIIKFRVKDLNDQNLNITEPNITANVIICNDLKSNRLDSIVLSSRAIDIRRKNNKNQIAPWNCNSESDNDSASIHLKTTNFALSQQKNHNFDTIKKQIFWKDYNKQKGTISSQNATSFSKKKSTFSHSSTMKNFEKYRTFNSEIPLFEEKVESVKEQTITEDDFNSISCGPFTKKTNKSNFFTSSHLQKINLSFEKKINCGKILIVDDDAFNLLSLEMILKIYGFDCIKAMNGQDAINILKNKSSNDIQCWEFKLIFMDYQMPVMDGVESTKEILKFKNIPIIGCTAFTTKEQITKCLDAGMKDVISKPISKEIIGKILEEWII